LRAAEAIQQSQAALLRTTFVGLLRAVFVAYPSLVWDEFARARSEKLLLLDNTQSEERNKSEQEGDYGSFGGILAACGRVQTRQAALANQFAFIITARG